MVGVPLPWLTLKTSKVLSVFGIIVKYREERNSLTGAWKVIMKRSNDKVY